MLVHPAPAKTPVGGAVRDAGKEKAMVTRDLKWSSGNPASTAALRRDVTSLSQRRAPRHPAGAAIGSGDLKRKIREEIMDGALDPRTGRFETHGLVSRITGGILALALNFAIPAAIAAAHAETRLELSRDLDRGKIENLQRWVNSGHDEWCKDSRLVAMDELRRLAQDFSTNAADLEAIPMDMEASTAQLAVFVWSPQGGRASYRVTVERFSWLLPIAGKQAAIVWVPTHAEILAQH